jgi:hypothetical protein
MTLQETTTHFQLLNNAHALSFVPLSKTAEILTSPKNPSQKIFLQIVH